MLDELQLFRGRDYVVNRSLTLHHPTLGEICDYGEKRYFNMVGTLCATPSDYKVTLWDDLHRDWEEVDELDLFGALCVRYGPEDAGILFGDFPLSQLRLAENPQNGERILAADGPDGPVVLDRTGYLLTAEFLRRIHRLKRHRDRCPSPSTKQYLLEKERRRLRRQRRERKPYQSVLVPLVSALVNCEQFKYDHRTVWELPVYTFYDSVLRIQKIRSCDRIVYGAWIDLQKIDRDAWNWMGALDLIS